MVSPVADKLKWNGVADHLPPESVIFGCSQVMQAVAEKVRRVTASNIPVLIQGESGTGKEIIARLLHERSPWRDGPLVKVNCPAIPQTLLESELFGYEKGAFTGAYDHKLGRVEQAHRGTLFLDEIAELEPHLQAKFLEVLQDGQFCRIGAQETSRIEARILCATNRDLEAEMESGAFRRDLFYRINVVSIQLPPLRERREDIPQLAHYFLDFYNQAYNRHTTFFSPELMQLLNLHPWPGNIRELENLIKRYVILDSEEAIVSGLQARPQMHPRAQVAPDGSISLKKVTREAVRELEGTIILQALQANQWNRKRAARALNISYRALLYKIKDAGLSTRRLSLASAAAAPAGNGSNPYPAEGRQS